MARDELVSTYKEYLERIKMYEDFHTKKMKMLNKLTKADSSLEYKKLYKKYQDLKKEIRKEHLEAPPIPPAPKEESKLKVNKK